jgi:ABC-2 type transport system ATP-binding protein
MKAVLQKSGRESLAVTTERGFLPISHGRQASLLVALRVDGLSKRYGSAEAVAGLSFDIEQGEVFGLLGPNGAGKTTTIAMLATQRRPSGGDAILFGHSICHEPSAIRQMIGLAPQEIGLYPRLTAAENLRFFGRIYGVKGAPLAARVDELLGFVGLEAHRDSYVGTFSGGMQRRLNLAAALVHEPRLILLDEPTAGVDPQSRSHILELVGRLRAAGAAILYTTHYMEEAQELCDRLGIIDQGKMVAMGTLDALLANSNCAEIIELHGVAPGTNFDALRYRPGLLRMESIDGQVRMQVKNAASFLEPLQQIINRSRKPVHLKISPPSLERLFLELTGRELRD